MAQTPVDLSLLPSIMDRLVDSNPEVRRDPSDPIMRTRSVRELKASVGRDLESLLNTRTCLVKIPSDLNELQNSVLVYGLPDFSGQQLTAKDSYERIGRSIEQVISRSEPRLRNVRVALSGADQDGVRALHFVIDALLRVEPTPEPVRFDTVLQLHNGEYQVERDVGL